MKAGRTIYKGLAGSRVAYYEPEIGHERLGFAARAGFW